VTLERNYRSTQAILDASNAVIGEARERHAKNLWTDKPSSHRA
jgi:DNA helicase II / ATP-dependent DNA helicase PcrA